MQRMTWKQICCSEAYRGRWIALDECRYDEHTGVAAEGAVVDADDDLVELCQRLRGASEARNCEIFFCDDDRLNLS